MKMPLIISSCEKATILSWGRWVNQVQNTTICVPCALILWCINLLDNWYTGHVVPFPIIFNPEVWPCFWIPIQLGIGDSLGVPQGAFIWATWHELLNKKLTQCYHEYFMKSFKMEPSMRFDKYLYYVFNLFWPNDAQCGSRSALL